MTHPNDTENSDDLRPADETDELPDFKPLEISWKIRDVWLQFTRLLTHVEQIGISLSDLEGGLRSLSPGDSHSVHRVRVAATRIRKSLREIHSTIPDIGGVVAFSLDGGNLGDCRRFIDAWRRSVEI